MEIIIQGNAKEIAALVVELQERQNFQKESKGRLLRIDGKLTRVTEDQFQSECSRLS